MGLPRYNVASYLTLSYYRNRPSRTPLPARPELDRPWLRPHNRVPLSRGKFVNCSRTRLGRTARSAGSMLRTRLRFENCASSPRTRLDAFSPRGLSFSRYHPLGAHLPARYNPPYPLGRFYLARSVKRLLQVGQNWKVELRISFRSFRVIRLARARFLHTIYRLSPFPVLPRIHQARFDPGKSRRVREIIKRECIFAARKERLLITVPDSHISFLFFFFFEALSSGVYLRRSVWRLQMTRGAL